MRFVIVTGLSGAGKSQVLRSLEDMGYYCVDNLPPTLIGKFSELCGSKDSSIKRVALGIDIRGGEFFKDIFNGLLKLKEMNIPYEILYVEANDEVLIRRFSETRRQHPLQGEGRVSEGIAKEREMLFSLKESANRVVDTSSLSIKQLQNILQEYFVSEEYRNTMLIHVLSFGYKYGIPLDVDIMWDVRFISNPFYIDAIRTHSGKDADVRDYVMSFEETHTFLTDLTQIISSIAPSYIREGKKRLSIGIGCTGGQHRSVVIAEQLAEHLRALGQHVTVEHRDLKAGEKDV